MEYYETISNGIRVDSFNENCEVILLGIFDSLKLGLSDSKMLIVADYSKLGEYIGSKEDESLGVSKWGIEGTTEGNMLGNNVRNY